MKSVGLVGWRGMVGSVLIDRMLEEDDFSQFSAAAFSTSQAGLDAPEWSNTRQLLDAKNIDTLANMDIIVSCQGGDYTSKIRPLLDEKGWQGYWIDAASTLRMDDKSIITLDPVNIDVIEKGLDSGIKNFIGGNCTVSLMLMAIGGLFKTDAIEWMTSMTYQAASGGGARHMTELIHQMACIADGTSELLSSNATALKLDEKVNEIMRSSDFPDEHFSTALAGSLIPWIDKAVDAGQTREEWKGFVETNKILGRTNDMIPVDGTCVRIGSMRCHSQAFTIKLKENLPIDEVQSMIESHNDWVQWVDNTPEETREKLSPKATTGTLKIPIGRVRKMNLGDKYLNAFSVGDQLLWGAAEPLRRTLRIILSK